MHVDLAHTRATARIALPGLAAWYCVWSSGLKISFFLSLPNYS